LKDNSEKGEHIEATANFTINTGSTLPIELNPTFLTEIAVVIGIVAVASTSLVYFKKRSQKSGGKA
jgi:hypothetical protein